jgi:hypothetical protein
MKKGVTRWINAPGTALESLIERRVLTPAERYAPAIVRTLRKCGGCKQARRALNGEGDTTPQV